MDEEFKIIEESDSKPEKKKKKRGRKSKAEKMIDDMSDLWTYLHHSSLNGLSMMQ